jgi:Pin2-interacting protein X1
VSVMKVGNKDHAEFSSSRQKHLHSKRLASASPAALAEILGVPASALPAIPSPSPTPALEIRSSSISVPAIPADPAPPSLSATPAAPTRDAEEVISTSTLSVSDYFQRKLREKMLARQAAASASGSVTPTLSEGSLALAKEEVKVVVGGTEWEGSRTTFEQTTWDSAVAGPSSIPFTPSTSIDSDTPVTAKLSKEEKRAAKAARREAKEAKRALKASREAAPSSAETTEVGKKRKRSERGDGTREPTQVASNAAGVLEPGEDDGVSCAADPQQNADKNNNKERKQKRDKGDRSEKRAKKEKAGRTVKSA